MIIHTIQPGYIPPIDSNQSIQTTKTVDTVIENKYQETNKIPIQQFISKQILAQCKDKNRAHKCINHLKSTVGFKVGFEKYIQNLVWAASTNRDKKGTEGLVTNVQAEMALKKLYDLDEKQLKRVISILDKSENQAQLAILLKGIGSQYLQKDSHELCHYLKRLHSLIVGKKLGWLMRKSVVYGIQNDRGIRESYTTTCGPMTKLITMAEYDPLLALLIATDKKPAIHVNSRAGRYQAAIMKNLGKTVVPRSLWSKIKTGTLFRSGDNIALARIIRDTYSNIGYELAITKGWYDNFDQQKKTEFLNTCERYIENGFDLPIELAPPKQRQFGHFEVIVDYRYKDDKRLWRIHDPWKGRTRWMSDKTLCNRKLDLWGNHLIEIWYPKAI